MFNLTDKIFNLFGIRYKTNDINKDVNGKGFFQRYIEKISTDFDNNELDKVNNLLKNISDARTLENKYILYKTRTFGGPLFFTNNFTIKRKFILYANLINDRRGTFSGYKILFNMIGIPNCVITEYRNSFGFDSGTFDDIDRRWDQRCKKCSKYKIELTGIIPLTAEVIQTITSIIEYNQPIDASLLLVTYNGAPLTLSGDFLSLDFWNDFLIN